MLLSLSEANALARKAMRGAGAPWGLAEEAGCAVHWLEAQGLPGLTTLASLLDPMATGWPGATIRQHGQAAFRNPDGPLCPIVAGATLSDNAPLHPGDALMFRQVSHALLFLPFAVMAGRRLDPQIDGQKTAPIDLTARPGQIQIALKDRCTMSAHTLAVLEHLAHATYVPATEASRQRGAGTGLTDND